MIRFEPGNGKSNHFCLTLWIPGAWAETHGIQVGDQLLAIGGASVECWIAAQRQSAVGRFTATGPQRVVVQFRATPEDAPWLRGGSTFWVLRLQGRYIRWEPRTTQIELSSETTRHHEWN